MKERSIVAVTLVAAVAVWAVAHSRSDSVSSMSSEDTFGLPPLSLPADVVLALARVELGRKLFFDRRLSFNGTMSCAMCHVPEEGFTSHASKTSVGIEGKSLKRNAPTLLNVAWQTTLFHDGRESSLVSQAWSPLLHPDEMANPSVGSVLDRIRGFADYDRKFERAFEGGDVSMDRVGAALAAYEATLVSANSRFDRWRYRGEANALSSEEQQGFALFAGKAQCIGCHLVSEKNALFADGKFHVTGIGFQTKRASFTVPLAPGVETTFNENDLRAFANRDAPDLGRFEITLNVPERYAFRTPTLRNVARTAPYMHDGSLASLEEVIDFYDRGGGDVSGKSAFLKPLGLTAEEKRALVAFLKALDGANVVAIAAKARE